MLTPCLLLSLVLSLWVVSGTPLIPLPTDLATSNNASAAVQVIEVDCNAVPWYSILNATAIVRFNNCSRRLPVYVYMCGIEFPLMIEVSGGITVPNFLLSSCGVWGSVSFLISGVLMLYDDSGPPRIAGSVLASSFGNPLEQTLLAFSGSVGSVHLVVKDSTLTFNCTMCTILLFDSFGTNITNASIEVRNTSFLVWSNVPGLIFVDVGAVYHNLSFYVSDSTVACVSQYQLYDPKATFGILMVNTLTIANMTVVTMERCDVNWDAAVNALASLQLIVFLGRFRNALVVIASSNFSAQVGRAFQLVSLSQSQSTSDFKILVERCRLDVVLNVTESTLTSVLSTFQPGIILISFSFNDHATNIIISVAEATLIGTVDHRSLSKPLLVPMTVPTTGTYAIVALSYSPMSNATISVCKVACNIEEVGRLSIAPYIGTAQFGFSFTTAMSSLVFSFGNSSQYINVTVASSSLTTRNLDSDNKLFLSPSVLSGIFFRFTAAVAISSTLKLSILHIVSTTVTAKSLAYATSPMTVWNVVEVLYHGTSKNYMAADFRVAMSLFSNFVDDAVSINDSTIVIANSTTTMQSSSLSDQAEASVILSTAFRLSVVLAALSNLKNTTVTVMNSSVFSSGADSLSPMLRSSECVAVTFVIPSSTWSSGTITSQNTSVTFPTPSLLCASFEATLESVYHNIIGVSLRGNSASEVGSDTFRLAPLSNKFTTTLQLRNVSVRITQSTMSGVRSVLGNLTTTKASTHQTSNNVALAISPVTVSMPSCSSNRWDGDALTCTDMLRPVDGQRAVDWSSARISVDDAGDSWCARCPDRTLSLTLPKHATTHSQAQPPLPPKATRLTTTGAAVTTAALVLAMLTSSSGAASVLPRLQGMVGSLKLASRCVAQSADPTGSDGDTSSSGSSNYAANDVSDNPFLLQLSSTEPSLAYAAGALVGNTVLVVAVAVVSHLAHRWERWAQRELRDAGWPGTVSGKQKNAQQQHNRYPVSAILGMTCCRVLPTTPLPASLMQLQGLLLQPVVAAAVACIASNDRDVLSVMLAVVIGSAWIAVPCVFMWLLCVKYSPLPLITIYSRRTNAQRMRWKRGGDALEWLCAEQEEWVAARGVRAVKADARHVKLRLSAVFAGYRGGRHWYFGVDALQSVLTGAIVGAAESVDASGACSAVVWGTACVGVVAAVTAVLCIVLQPHVVRFELLAAVVVSLLAVLAAVLILADDVNGAAVVSLVAAAAELLPLAARLVWNACLRSRELDDTTEPVPVSGGVNGSSFSPLSLQHAAVGSCDPTTAAREQRALPINYSNRVARVLPPMQEEALIALLESICRTERLNPFLLSE